MPKKKHTGPLRVSAPRTAVEPVGEGALVKTRINPPHQLGSAEPAAAPGQATAAAAAKEPNAPRAASAASPSRHSDKQPAGLVPPLDEMGLAYEQMQSQAAQLAAQLCKQQATLDHREAEVNARAAAVESQVRAARLWLVEKLEELAQQRAEIGSAAAADARRAPAGHARTADHDPPASQADASADRGSIGDTAPSNEPDQEPAAPQGTLRFWQQLHWPEEFERWRREREAASEGSSATAAHDDRGIEETPARSGATSAAEQRLRAVEQQLTRSVAELETRRRELAAASDALQAEREAFALERQSFLAERQGFLAERQADLHRLADQRRVMSEKLARQRARLRRRRDDFDAREMALRQLRAELLRMQQQALEMRLGAEEQWARMRGKSAATDGPARPDPRDFAADARREGAA